MNISMRFERETKGALRYQEVDEQGNDVDQTHGALIGTLYLRKEYLKKVGVGLTPPPMLMRVEVYFPLP